MPTRFCSVSGQISRKTVDSTYPINSFEEEGFSQKTSASFCLLKINFINMSCLLRGICQLKMPPANEITEPLGKAIVFQSRFRRIRFRLVVNSKGQNGEKRCATRQNETEEQLLKRDYKKALLTDMKVFDIGSLN